MKKLIKNKKPFHKLSKIVLPTIAIATPIAFVVSCSNDKKDENPSLPSVNWNKLSFTANEIGAVNNSVPLTNQELATILQQDISGNNSSNGSGGNNNGGNNNGGSDSSSGNDNNNGSGSGSDVLKDTELLRKEIDVQNYRVKYYANENETFTNILPSTIASENENLTKNWKNWKLLDLIWQLTLSSDSNEKLFTNLKTEFPAYSVTHWSWNDINSIFSSYEIVQGSANDFNGSISVSLTLNDEYVNGNNKQFVIKFIGLKRQTSKETIINNSTQEKNTNFWNSKVSKVSNYYSNIVRLIEQNVVVSNGTPTVSSISGLNTWFNGGLYLNVVVDVTGIVDKDGNYVFPSFENGLKISNTILISELKNIEINESNQNAITFNSIKSENIVNSLDANALPVKLPENFENLSFLEKRDKFNSFIENNWNFFLQGTNNGMLYKPSGFSGNISTIGLKDEFVKNILDISGSFVIDSKNKSLSFQFSGASTKILINNFGVIENSSIWTSQFIGMIVAIGGGGLLLIAMIILLIIKSRKKNNESEEEGLSDFREINNYDNTYLIPSYQGESEGLPYYEEPLVENPNTLPSSHGAYYRDTEYDTQMLTENEMSESNPYAEYQSDENNDEYENYNEENHYLDSQDFDSTAQYNQLFEE